MWAAKAGNTICKMSKRTKMDRRRKFSFIAAWHFNACHLENLMRKRKL